MSVAELRRMGSFLVNETEGKSFDRDPHLLLDISGQTAADLLAEFHASQAKYQTAPFDVDGHELRFYPGGVSLWSGFPGSGKTTVLRQMACHLMHRGAGVFFASLEENPKAALIGLSAVAGAVPLGTTPGEDVLQAFMDGYRDQLRVWGVIGIAKHREILATIRALAGQGVTHAFIDSLMMLDVRNDDIETQRQFAVLVAATAKETGVHIHLVAHPKKPIAKDQEPDLNDVAGAKEIGGIADNVLFIQRGVSAAPGYGVPMKVLVRKQRNWKGGWPTYEGYFSHEHRQFAPTPHAEANVYLR